MYKIQPITFPILGTANRLIVRALSFEMTATTASFYFELLEAGGPQNGGFGIQRTITNGNIHMNAEEFAAWGADNQYVVDWACNKLGVILDTTPDPVITEEVSEQITEEVTEQL